MTADTETMTAPWVSTHTVEAAEPFDDSTDLLLGETMRDPDKRVEFQPRPHGLHAYTLRMRDVTLLPPGLVCKDGAPVEQTRYGFRPAEEQAALESLRQPHRRLGVARGFLGMNRFGSNYFHMLTQILPAAAAYQPALEASGGVLLLLLGAGGPVLHRAMTLAGIDTAQAVWMREALPVDIEDLSWSNFLGHCDDPSVFCRSLFTRMAAQVAPNDSPIIYISRTDTAARPLRNEAALIAALEAMGVTPVTLSGMSLDQQIALFRGASLIIGPHGAGLSNVVFATPGAVLYELFPHHYISPCMRRLAQMQGLHYWCDVHQAEDRPNVWRHQVGWSVDIPHVIRRLRELRTVYPLDRH